MEYKYLKDYNYLTIPAFAIKDLQLKGNALLIYSSIFNATQDKHTMFRGSIRYFEEITGASKRTIITTIKELCEKDYIKKFEFKDEKGCMYNKYICTINLESDLEVGGVEITQGGVEITLPIKETNTLINENNEKESSKEKENKEKLTTNKEIIVFSNENIVEETSTASKKCDIKSVIDYLNNRIGSNYRYSSQSTKRHINARIEEGYTLEDFMVVIDKKANEWLGTKMEKFLRPETLFGSKFEGYLNQSEAVYNNSFNRTNERQSLDDILNEIEL